MNCCVVYFYWYACLVIFLQIWINFYAAYQSFWYVNYSYQIQIHFSRKINVEKLYNLYYMCQISYQQPSMKKFLWFHYVKLEKAWTYKHYYHELTFLVCYDTSNWKASLQKKIFLVLLSAYTCNCVKFSFRRNWFIPARILVLELYSYISVFL